MTIVILAIVLAVVTTLVADFRRRAAIRCIEQAERLRIRFSALRHKLVMHAGSGQMVPTERNAFFFLYAATAFMLRHPKHYRLVSVAICSYYLSPETPKPPMLHRQDISEQTRPLLREYVEACDDLVQQFADPIVLFLAYLGGESVVDTVRNLGSRVRDLETGKRRVEAWREVGAQALG